VQCSAVRCNAGDQNNLKLHPFQSETLGGKMQNEIQDYLQELDEDKLRLFNVFVHVLFERKQ
jgi:hypothetical protein